MMARRALVLCLLAEEQAVRCHAPPPRLAALLVCRPVTLHDCVRRQAPDVHESCCKVHPPCAGGICTALAWEVILHSTWVW